MNLFALKPHPYSQIFPSEVTGTSFSELIASVKKLGRVRQAIIVYQNMVLDGNRRLRACKVAKIKDPKWVEFKGTESEALELVWDLNYNRRDLTPSSRAVAFAQYCSFLEHGEHGKEKTRHATSLDDAATKAGVSRSTMERAKKVVEHGEKKVIDEIRSGKKTVYEAVAEMPVRQGGNGEVLRDEGGFPVPLAAQEYWERRDEARTYLARLTEAERAIQGIDPKDQMYCEVNLNGVLSELESAISRFKAAVPSYVCGFCQGQNPKGCTACKGRGVVSKFAWSFVPEELRYLRQGSTKGTK